MPYYNDQDDTDIHEAPQQDNEPTRPTQDSTSEVGAAIGGGLLGASLGFGPVGALIGAIAGYSLVKGSKNDD